jgi:hypothetical protein
MVRKVKDSEENAVQVKFLRSLVGVIVNVSISRVVLEVKKFHLIYKEYVKRKHNYEKQRDVTKYENRPKYKDQV